MQHRCDRLVEDVVFPDPLPVIAQNKTVFVDAENLGKMVSPSSFSNEARESMSNVYTLFKKGK